MQKLTSGGICRCSSTADNPFLLRSVALSRVLLFLDISTCLFPPLTPCFLFSIKLVFFMSP